MFFLPKTNIYRCEILQRYKIDIEKTNQLYLEKYGVKGSGIDTEYCKLIAESEDYRFYGYRVSSDLSGGFILRQDKHKPKKVVYFGKNKRFNILFHGYLFQVNAYATSGFADSEPMIITARHIITGHQLCFEWLSQKYLEGYRGHATCQDSVHEVRIEGDALIFEVRRKKSRDITYDKYDIDMYYTLKVEYNGLKFKGTPIFPSVK